MTPDESINSVERADSKARRHKNRCCTCVLAERHLSGRDGVHLDYVVAVQFRVSVALIQQGGTNPVGITFHSLHLPDERCRWREG